MKLTCRTLALALALPLAACSSSGSDADQAALAEEAVDGLASGKWDISSRLASMDLSQADPDGVERAQEMMQEERTNTMCLELSQRTSPPATMFYPGNEPCSFKSFTMAKGRITGRLQCASDTIEPARLTGHYDQKAFSVTIIKTLPGNEGRTTERTYSTGGRHKGTC
ncbi:DUF3617 family protein [Novosphingobium sp. TH158]|uniref:DUF3617 family protein n=1 Tax=Novosphingobium sp. TH158 TaxID=2067455 RepID=UPI000C7D6F0F|nr:DUF3617 family protein [Novosphingobium sp. TH158]PLK25912.1 hypothetical protein C0V78_02635 [Novosphingobium sp. TH158]